MYFDLLFVRRTYVSSFYLRNFHITDYTESDSLARLIFFLVREIVVRSNIAVVKVGCIHHHFASFIYSFATSHTTVCNQSFPSIFFKHWCLCSPSYFPHTLCIFLFFYYVSSNILSIALFSLLVHWSHHFYFRLFVVVHRSCFGCAINYNFDDDHIYTRKRSPTHVYIQKQIYNHRII